MNLVYAPYPMTIAQMAQWAKAVSAYTPADCEAASNLLERRFTIRIRFAKPGEKQ